MPGHEGFLVDADCETPSRVRSARCDSRYIVSAHIIKKIKDLSRAVPAHGLEPVLTSLPMPPQGEEHCRRKGEGSREGWRGCDER